MAKAKAQKAKTEVKEVVSEPKVESSKEPAPAKIRRTNIIEIPIPSLSQQSGNLLVCGQNDVGQLGLNTDDVMEKTRPSLVSELSNISDVKAGGMHSLVLTKGGEIWSFGCNDEGALGRDTEEEGSETKPKKIELPGKAVKISAGDSHSACLLDDGRVYAWGAFRDSHGSMGLTTEGNKKSPVHVVPEVVAVDIASGNDHLVILTKNGHVYTIGCGEQGQLGRVSPRTLTGESRRGKTTLLNPGCIPKKAGKFIANAIWATPFCTFLRENKSNNVYGFGLNNYCQLGVKKGGKEFEHFPLMTKFSDVKALAGGQHHTIILTNDNKVYAIGRKDYGRLGLGSVESDIKELAHVKGLTDIHQITCGEASSFAITNNGKVYVWGMGSSSQLGTGDEDDVESPKLLASAQVKDKNILSVSSGGQHSLFLVEAPGSTAAKSVAIKETVPVNAQNEDPPITTIPEPVKAPRGNSKEKKESAKVVKAGNKKKALSVVKDKESTTDVNGNSEKDEPMDVDVAVTKVARKRKAIHQ
ncbi:CLUMA_CG011711, isoform A [Clunio marinus]|uniref:CLUMA_CG011711, isoform A n=1 Tax=Clunio marinus TaxID=568069 RepID=A0A1J1IDJ3_9DIPT|nr:CLUMA_CG011711, isoform A [Clunio marinus]